MLPQNGGVLLSGEQPSSNTLGLWTKEVMVAQNSSVTAHMDKCNDLANRRRICHSSWFLFALWFCFLVCQHSDLSNLWLFTFMWFYCISMNQVIPSNKRNEYYNIDS